MLGKRISNYLNQLMRELGETQEGLANKLRIPKSSLQRYLTGDSMPGIDVLMKISELGNTSLDKLVKEDNPKLEIKDSHHIAIAGRDNIININSHIKRHTTYNPVPEDITGEQANKLKDLVNKVVEYENQTKKKPKTYGAVWNALNRKMGVTYYREIKQIQFDMAELYLQQWAGRLKRGLKKNNEEEWRKERQSAIFAASRNQLGWTKESLDSYIYERFKKESIRDLTKKELEQLYNIIMGMKNK